MSTRYPGGLITKSPVIPTTTSAPGIWTLEQALEYIKAGTWPTPVVPSDPFFEYVTMLLPGNGTNGGQNNTFLDSSTNNFTITRNGNTTQGTFSPYGSNWSNYFNGAAEPSTDRLRITNTSALNLGSGDFTIECWWFSSKTLSDYAVQFAQLFGKGSGNGVETGSWALAVYQSKIYFATSAINLQGSINVTANTWNHFAVTRSGTTVRTFVNGVLDVSGSSSQDLTNNVMTFAIGDRSPNNQFGQYPFNGYISNVRTVVGTAVYTSNFTPSTTPLTAVSGTSLLTCADNRFIDDSTNNYGFTINGTPSVQRFSPFNPTASYATATIGGSGYFDGVGDYLTAPATSNLEFGSGDFTIEFWWYTTLSSRQALYHGSFGTDWSIGIDCTSQKIGIWASSNGTSWNLINADPGGNGVGTITLPVNSWNHIAYVRSGTTWSLYVNGVRDLNLTGISGSIVDRASSQKGIGVWWSAGVTPGPTTGYISNFRVLKGTALYSGATYTVPTAPLTAIVNTQLLLNTTNASIIDNAMMNNLETVGNAQISTSVSKFGGGSMAFDGTGDWLASPANPNVQFGTGDFTVEAWVYRSGSQAQFVGLAGLSGAASAGWFLAFGASNTVTFGTASAIVITSSSALSNTTWVHVAVSRSGTSIKMFFDGVQVASATDSTSFTDNAYGVRVGGSSGFAFNGYIDDLRITKGYARYTSNFTAPTEAFPTL
jgi:hypothetical protein